MPYDMSNLLTQSGAHLHPVRSRRIRALTGAMTVALSLLGLTSLLTYAQPSADPRAPFLDALGEFSLALNGTYGDEGPRLSSALDRMAQALSQWDSTIEGYESAMAVEITGAQPALAARMRVELGIVYLDRGRVSDALEEFAAARRLDPPQLGPPLFEALVYDQLLHEPDRAGEALRAAARLASRTPVVSYLFARHLRNSGDDGAREALGRFVTDLDAAAEGVVRFIRLGLVPETPGLEPFFPPVRYAEGFAALHQWDLAGALSRFRQALASDPLSVDASASGAARPRAAVAFRDGLVADARTALAESIAQSPERAETYRLLGLVEMADGRYEQAITALRRAVTMNGDDERARLALADALGRHSQPEEAVAVLEDTLVVMPGSGRARYALGLLHREQGRYVEARAALEEAVSRGPLVGLNSLYQTIGAVRRAQLDLEGAVDALTARVDLVPNDARARQDLGDIHFLLADNDAAVAEFMIAARLAPSSAAAHTALAQVYLRQARFLEAADAALRALRIDARDREARYVYGTALVRLGRSEEGTRELETFQRLQAEDADARSRVLELGRLRREASVATASGDHATAVGLLRQVLVYDPRAAATHLDLGLALMKTAQFAEALERLATAAALAAPIDVHLHLAEAYAALGRTEDSGRARSEYESLKRDAIRRDGASR
jgi:tetratricopeptide (TPR) repeat protein